MTQTPSSLNVSSKEFYSEEDNLHTFVKQMLQTRLFLGHFQERRYVDPLRAYRDLIVVAPSETDLKQSLEIVKKKLENFYGSDAWIGITCPFDIGTPAGYCLWVELPNQMFGHYWFLIKSVKFRSNEILLRLKCVRPLTSADEKVSCKEKNTTSQNVSTDSSDNSSLENWNNYFTEFKRTTSDNFLWFLTTVITIHNIKESIKFLSVLIAVVVTGTFNSLKYVGDYSLKFMHEISILVHALTPFALGCLDMISKIFGGFYILLAMVWRDYKTPRNAYNPNNPRIMSNRQVPILNQGYNRGSYRR